MLLFTQGSNMDSNPLAKFFRQPAIYIRLPSGGQGWLPGSIDYPANGEIPVLPMTAIDEITYRTPDALFNGESVVGVIQSCVPCIRNAWAVPSTDIDAILVAIRIASYGHSLDIASQCPSCKTEHDFGLDLRTVIDRLEAADYSKELTSGDLQVYFRPLNYQEINSNSQLQFEQQKILQLISDSENLAEQSKVDKINAMMKKLIEVTVKAMSQSITEIRTPESIVSDSHHIEEFLNNCDRVIFEKIRDHVIELREKSELKPLKIKCPGCSHEYQQAFTLDMARFFEPAS
jgi:hypothetical protein